MTDPATETNTIGLPSNLPAGRQALSCFGFCSPLRQFTVMRKLCAIYQDIPIWTPSSGRENCTFIYQDLQKLMPTLTPRLWRGRLPATAHTTGPLAARQICPKFSLYRDFRRARKSFAALPCNRPFAAKHMLFCPPGLRHLDNF